MNKNEKMPLSLIWRDVLRMSAVYDVLAASPDLYDWFFDKNNSSRIMKYFNKFYNIDFNSNLYEEIISILKTLIIEDDSISIKTKDSLVRKLPTPCNIYPQTAFYQLIGNPENIYLG